MKSDIIVLLSKISGGVWRLKTYHNPYSLRAISDSNAQIDELLCFGMGISENISGG